VNAIALNPTYTPTLLHSNTIMMKLYIKTHGCQMNVYDSTRIVDLLRETHPLELSETEEAADILLLNTCSVREKAQEKVFFPIGSMEIA